MQSINASTKLCAVIGHPVGHSLSPAIHNAAFDASDQNYVYLAFDIEDLPSALAGMRAMPSFRGMSVTIPHKTAIIPYLDEIDPMAQHVGSVNTVTHTNGQLRGSTTDGPGTLRAFEEANVSLDDKKILFLGSGGAVRAVAFAFATDANPKLITILGRTPSKVTALTNDLKKNCDRNIQSGDLTTDLETAVEDHDIIINGTPMGMYPNNTEESPVPAHYLRPDHTVFDMVYRPLETKLIRAAQERGATTILGIEMLLNQAVLQFETWTNLPAPRDTMREALLKALNNDDTPEG